MSFLLQKLFLPKHCKLISTVKHCHPFWKHTAIFKENLYITTTWWPNIWLLELAGFNVTLPKMVFSLLLGVRTQNDHYRHDYTGTYVKKNHIQQTWLLQITLFDQIAIHNFISLTTCLLNVYMNCMKNWQCFVLIIPMELY